MAKGGKKAQSESAAQQERLPIIDAGADASFDPWADEHLPDHPKVGPDDIAKELKRVLRKGLPLTHRRAGEVLPNLRSVIARSVHPYDLHSRVASLNQLLVRFLADGEEPVDEAARVMFAVALGTKGTTLEIRRKRAARVMGYEEGHFRKRIEPEIIGAFADVLYADLLRYKRRVRRAPVSEEPTGDTPKITEDDFTHQEELVSRIWKHVYGLRAELIAVGRLEGQPGYESQVEDQRRMSERESAAVQALLGEFKETYGEGFVMHGDAEYRL